MNILVIGRLVLSVFNLSNICLQRYGVEPYQSKANANTGVRKADIRACRNAGAG